MNALLAIKDIILWLIHQSVRLYVLQVNLFQNIRMSVTLALNNVFPVMKQPLIVLRVLTKLSYLISLV